jgi:GT2 family glycosyltransferase
MNVSVLADPLPSFTGFPTAGLAKGLRPWRRAFAPGGLESLAGPAVRAPTRLASLQASPRLSVVIVNYQHWHDTIRLMQQLRTSTCLRRGEAEIVVVDNSSTAHPFIPRLRRLPGVSLRRWRANRGFARAVNEGCRLSCGEWFLLLNPDMTLAPGFLDDVLPRAIALTREDEHTGIVGFHLRNPDGTRQLSSGPFPTLLGTLAGLFLPRARRKYRTPPEGGPCRVDWATGCCLLVRRACWEDLGGFDPEFFLYYEDVDLCRRAQQRGWSVWFDPNPRAIHHRPLHAREVPAHMRLITRHALLAYARKHWAAWQYRALIRIVGLETRVREWIAHWRGNTEAAHIFAELGMMIRDLGEGDSAGARRRLAGVVRHQEELGAAVAVDRHSQSPAPGPVAPVPGQCGAVCPAWD